MQHIGHLGLGQGNGVALFPLGQFEALVQLLVEIRVAHLLEDVGIPGFVHLERLVAVGADDVVHGVIVVLVSLGGEHSGHQAKQWGALHAR